VLSTPEKKQLKTKIKTLYKFANGTITKDLEADDLKNLYENKEDTDKRGITLKDLENTFETYSL
jgi:hypothetical protein